MRPQHHRFGGVLGDVTDPFVDVLTSARDRIPLDDIADVFKDVAAYLSEPITDVWNNPKRTILRVVSVMGWPGFLASFLPGALGLAAERALVAFPGLADGESFTHAFRAEAAWRMKMVERYTFLKAALDYADAVDKASKSPQLQVQASKQRFDQLVEDLKRRGFDEALSRTRSARSSSRREYFSALCQQLTGSPCRQDALATVVNGLLRRPLCTISPNSTWRAARPSASPCSTPRSPRTSPRRSTSASSARPSSDSPRRPPSTSWTGSSPSLVLVRRTPLSRSTIAGAPPRAPPATRPATQRCGGELTISGLRTRPQRLPRLAPPMPSACSPRRGTLPYQEGAPPAPRASVRFLTKLDGRIQDLGREVQARFRESPAPAGSVRVLPNPDPLRAGAGHRQGRPPHVPALGLCSLPPPRDAPVHPPRPPPMNRFHPPVFFGGVVDNARVRWQEAEAAAIAADNARVGSTDPELNRRAAALRGLADNLKRVLDVANAASDEAPRHTPPQHRPQEGA